MARWLSVAALVIVLDQITKYIANTGLVYAHAVPVIPSFNLTLMYNRGAAFSFLSDAGGWQRWFFVTVSLLASVLLIVWLYKLKPQQRMLALALSLVLGGAVGNLIDRLWFGYVIDFIQLYYRDFYWPAFNVADSAITIGAAILIWDALFAKPEPA
jgi:signal peptidase II